MSPSATSAPIIEPPAPAARPTRLRRRRPRRLSDLTFALTAAGLVILNAWWLYRDLRPLPDLARANRLIAGGQEAAAEAALRAILARSPRDGDAHKLLARVRARRGDVLGCAVELHAVPAWWPGKREAQYYEAEAYKQMDRARDAESAWRGCVNDDPLHPAPPALVRGAAQELLALFMLEERKDDAREILGQAFQQADPAERPAILGNRMRVEAETIDPKEAAVALRKYVAADPGDWQARRALARMEQALGHADEADRQIALALRDRPAEPAVWRDKLRILEFRKDRAGLIAAAASLPRACDADPAIWRYRGLARQSAGDLDGAAVALREATTRDPHDDEAHYLLAGIAQRQGRAAEAAEHRRIWQAIRQARLDLPTALEAYRAALAGSVALPPAVRRLADLAEAIGWDREAEELRKLADQSSE